VARCLNNLASVAHTAGDRAEALRLYEECRATFEGRGDRVGVAWALDQAGDVARDAGDNASARSFYEQSLAVFRELGDKTGVASALADLARLARRQGDLQTAALRCREALALPGTGSQRADVLLLEELASLAAATGGPERALVLFAAAAGLRTRLGWPSPPGDREPTARLIEAQRDKLGSGAVGAWGQGWRMNAEEAVQYARKEA